MIATWDSGNLLCSSGKSSLLSSCEGECSIALESLEGNHASAHTEGVVSMFFLSCSGKIWFHSSCEGDIKEPLMLPQGSQASFQVALGGSGFLSSCCRGIGPHLELRRELQGSSQVATWISVFLMSFKKGVRPRLMLSMELRFPLEMLKGCQASYPVHEGNLGFFLKVQWGSQTSLRVGRR